MRLNPPGQMVERWWVELLHKFPANGARGIVGADLCVGPAARADADVNVDPAAEQGAHTGAPVRNGAQGIVGADLCVGPAAARADPTARIDPISRADANVNVDPAAEQGAHAGAPVRNGARGIVGADLCVGPVARADADVNVDPAAEQGAHTGAPVRNGARGIVGADLCVGPAAGADADMQRIEEYIRNNPRRWTEDQLHPQAAPNKFNQDR